MSTEDPLDSSEQTRQAIWSVLNQLPFGKVTTYGRIARMIGKPNHARFVGTTLKRLPSGSQLPWYRVLNAQGKIAFPEGSSGYVRQVKCLQEEGIEVNNGRVCLNQYLS